MLGSQHEIVSLKEIQCHEDIPEEQDTLEGNALQKARCIHEKYGLDCFADDTGLEIKALNNAPGVYSARYAGNAGSQHEKSFTGNAKYTGTPSPFQNSYRFNSRGQRIPV